MPLDRIGPEDVAAWFDAASKDKPGAANRAFEVLRATMLQEAQLPAFRHDRDVRAPALERGGAQRLQIAVTPILKAPASGETIADTDFVGNPMPILCCLDCICHNYLEFGRASGFSLPISKRESESNSDTVSLIWSPYRQVRHP